MKHLWVLVVLVAFAVLVTGCGNGDNGSDEVGEVDDGSDEIGEVKVTCLVPSSIDSEECAQIRWEVLDPDGTVQLRTTLDFETPNLDPNQLLLDFDGGNYLDLVEDAELPDFRVQFDDLAYLQLRTLEGTGAFDRLMQAFPTRCRIVRAPWARVPIPVCS